LVESGVDLTKIAAITFTEKAAAELRVRVREELRRRPPSPLIERALASLGDAPMSTLHSFARRILTEHGLAVGVPPRFELLDEVGEAIYLENQWRHLASRLFDPDGELSDVVARAVELGMGTKHLREIAAAMHQSYDRLREVPRPYEWPSKQVQLAPVDLSGYIEALRGLSTDDPILIDHLHQAEDARTDLEAIDVVRTDVKLPGGNKGKPAREALTELRTSLRRDVIAELVAPMAATVLEWAATRTRDGELLFHDLLVLARDALRDPEVRASCRVRYERILIDEFQDTDPLQIEIAVLLASSRPDIADRRWDDVPLTADDAGRLFFVGDPKQSIYRFRRADIDLYRRAQTVFAHSPLYLTENFRTVESIVDFVNGLFDPWMGSAPEGTQPEYVELTAHIANHDPGPAVETIGGEDEIPAAEVRALEADAVVRVIAFAKQQGWQVRDPLTRAFRPARYADIAVLMPTRASLPALDHGLDAAGIPARVESRTLIWNTAEVRDLTAVLTAVSDPNDQVAIVAALRSPGLACSDLDLSTWRWKGGRWSYISGDPALVDSSDRVAAGLAVLRGLHRERWWLSIGEMVRLVIEACRFRELAFAHARPRDRWRRIDFVLAQARAFEEAGGTSIEEFVSWCRDQAEREVWVNDAIAPDPDDDAVRILTVHASKGLEFPIVVLMGLNSQHRASGPPVLWGEHGPELKAGPEKGDRFETDGYGPLWNAEKGALAAERVRLAYVAMTRARDRLVVSLFRGTRGETLAKGVATHCPPVTELNTTELPVPAPAIEIAEPVADSAALGDRDAWISERAVNLARLGRSPAIAATRLKAPLAMTERDDDDPGSEDEEIVEVAATEEADDRIDDQPPWRRGRAGTAIGRAVHAVLQTVDLATGEGANTLSVAQAAAEGVPALAGEIERRVRQVLEAPSVEEAVATGRYWREVFLAAPVEGRVLEGFIDLLYENANGELAVVDYKTDGVRNEAEADAAVARYRLQGAAYALAVSSSLGRPVSRCVFLFANPTRWFERDLRDLEAACDEVAGLVASA
jgi:ATP-dependent helicase/nuclease subunit A